MTEHVDSVSHASLNGLYVKAKELDRGHNEHDAPAFEPAGQSSDTTSSASVHGGYVESRAGDTESHASDAETHASTHASDTKTQTS